MPLGPACTLGMQRESQLHAVTLVSLRLLCDAADLVGGGLWDHISKAHALA